MSSRQTGQDFVNIFTPFPAGRDQFFPPLPSLCLSLSLSSPLPFQRFASHNAPERTNEVKYGSLVETNERPSKRYFHYLRINKFSVFRRPTQPRYIFFFLNDFWSRKISSFFIHARLSPPPLPLPIIRESGVRFNSDSGQREFISRHRLVPLVDEMSRKIRPRIGRRSGNRKGRKVLPTKIAALVVSAIQDLRETKGSTPSKIIGYISYVSEMNDDKVKRQVSDTLSSEIKPLLFADYSQLFNRVYIKLLRSLLSLLARKSQRARIKNEQVGSLVVVSVSSCILSSF